MPAWRREAIKRLPEFQKEIARAESVMGLWIELGYHFQRAYRDPRDDSLIERIYSYADWCTAAPGTHDAGTDPFTAVACAFYEHIPQSAAARDDMPRWFTHQQVLDSTEIFSRFLEPAEFQALLNHLRKNVHLYRERKVP